jgi:acyl-CoA thioesterase
MASADKPRSTDLTPAEAQRISERAAETLVAPRQTAVYPGDAGVVAAVAGGTPLVGASKGSAIDSTGARADAQRLAERAAEALFARDTAAKLLGYHVLGVGPGSARVGMTVRADMCNGHHTCHGGLIFALADSAFAAACNSHNESNVAAAASIDFLAPAREGDELIADATEAWLSGRTGIYEIKVTNQRGELIALFRGRSHRIGGPVTTD